MSFNIEFSYSTTGIVSVKIPTSQLNSTFVDQAPFSIQYRFDVSAESQSFPENPVSPKWTAFDNGGFTTYTRYDGFSPGVTLELRPIADVNNPNYISFAPTGFQSRSDTPITVSATEPVDVTPPPIDNIGSDNIAPTLDPNGIQKTQFMADGTTPLPQTAKDSAYIVSFSERVSIPLASAQSAFGGMPPGSTFVVMPMTSSPMAGNTAVIGFSDLWHVQVTTPTADAKVNLTLTPKLQVDTYETTNAAPPSGTQIYGSSTQSTQWAKVTLDGDLYEGRDFDSGQLSVNFMRQDDSFGAFAQTVAVATSTSAKNVLYLGFEYPPPQPNAGDEIQLNTISADVNYQSPLGGLITDIDGNQMEYVSVANTTSPMEPLVSVLTDGNIGAFFSQGTSSGFDVLDMHLLTQGPLVVEADYGFMTVYDAAGNPRRIEIDFYDKYILNDRVAGKVGNTFYGTDDSEYVVVGNGGDNFLRAGNQGSGSMAPETDIVDYSKVIGSGITVDLGNSVSKDVEVTYSDNLSFDVIRGFEGVVGSGVADTISGSNAGNYISGGDGNDTLRGYSLNNQGLSTVTGDLMYDQVYLDRLYGAEHNRNDAKWAEFFADSSDMLVGGAGMDTMYGGAGSDFLVDLDAAVMWGSDVGTRGTLRDNNNSDLAEYDAFMVRGSTTETATIENFHLSKNGTGLAGRSYDSHDSIVFSTDIDQLIKDAYDSTKGGSTVLGEALFGEFLTDNLIPQLKAGMSEALYHYVYDNLTFTQTQVAETNDMKLTATFSDKFGDLPTYNMVMGEVIIADLVTALGTKKAGRFQNQAEVVELAWLADTIVNAPERFNPKMDLDMINADSGYVSSFKDMEIAFALELLQAGTIREANNYGVMASNLDDMSLDERIFNPDDDDNTILGSAGKDIYEFIVQDFDVTKTTDKDFDAGNDTIFDIGGNNDILAFSEAKIDELTFSAVKVGRESGRSSLRVEYEQTLNPGNPTKDIKNSGEITWQGHFREGGRQAAEFVEVSNGSGGVEKYAMAKTEYDYDMKGYVIAGSDKVVANNMFNAIMVGRNDGADEFVFKATSGSSQIQQKASIAGYNNGDNIDISAYVTEYGLATHVLAADKKSAVVTFDKTPENTSSVNFSLELAFQEAVVGDLQFLYGTTLPI